MKKPVSNNTTSPMGPALPESGTVLTVTEVGRTRTGATVRVQRYGSAEWCVFVGDERIVVGKDHALALVVAEAWCAGRAIHVEMWPA